MSGSDVYDDTAIPSGDWSSTVIFTPGQDGGQATIQVASIAPDSASLFGTVSRAGDLVTLSIGGSYPFQEQLEAVCGPLACGRCGSPPALLGRANRRARCSCRPTTRCSSMADWYRCGIC